MDEVVRAIFFSRDHFDLPPYVGQAPASLLHSSQNQFETPLPIRQNQNHLK